MKFIKSLAAVLVTTLALGAGAAVAEPVLLEYTSKNFQSDDEPVQVSDRYGFTLSDDTVLGGVLKTFSTESKVYLNITQAYLLSGDGTKVALTEAPGVTFPGTETWTLAPTQLAAGDWALYVVGLGMNAKGPDHYTVTLESTAQDLPEPAGLALVAIALSALAVAARRRAKR
ncbi:MAG: hypothetical protein DI603_23235 [Roseateles depolymerans]|uniref:PEP-CTERM protein-sorting domain-containing protein n=1 Tax=Roseateles depolymerans TaxID=76731 RepID=A0A2W5D8Q0_9BURK|nr:MAG: hypothetical protein DI603_23235 [Roseateles depolymerans]